MEKLSEATCWELLRGSEVGRLAVVVENLPEIFPVNYVVDHGTVVFRTAEGTKAGPSREKTSVAFEVDGYDAADRQAWSVVVKGRAERVRDADEAEASVRLPLYPWHDAPKSIFVRVVPDEVSGRRFAVADTVSWVNSLAAARPTPPE
jgi:uncharacterized protein